VSGSSEDDYAQAGFDGKLELGKHPVLLIVDPATAYVDPTCPLFAGVEALAVAEEILRLRRKAERLGIPIFVTRVAHDSAQMGGVFAKKVPSLKWLQASSPFSAYIDGLSPGTSATEVTKQYASAFAGTSLASTLTALGCDTVVVTGFSTSGCIRATATDAMQGGFVPVIGRAAVGDRLPAVHEANLFDMQAKVGEVVESTIILSLFKETAQWPSL
jgi:maleamate amidohydrolase